MSIFKQFLLGLFFSFFVVIDCLIILFVFFLFTIQLSPPTIVNKYVLALERTKVDSDFYTINNNWIKKSETGLWEMYIEGDGFERGVIEGKLNKELAEKQEIAFVSQIREIIPSEGMLNYLKFFIAFFNRNIDQYIPEEYKEEIYGESIFASDKFDFMAPKYYRMLNYHAAHDIGHALQDKNMTVGCTAFSAWNQKSADNSLIVGRNFDFYVGDAFAEDKLMNFVKPKEGYKLMMISWAGMIGTLSGINEKGLTVTINASKSEIPTSAATPISLVAREILQYAKNIDEAFEIAKKRKTFVSESILIGTAMDNKAATIEKTPSKTELFYSETNDYIICANHYQGKAFANDKVNNENKEKSSSMYRFKHLTQLIETGTAIDVSGAAVILRNQKGIDDKNIGMGNEKALNQLIAHHSVIFKPKQLQMWVSTSPLQLGQYVCYDLNKVFAEASNLKTNKEIYSKELNVPADSFLYSSDYQKFKAYKLFKKGFAIANKHSFPINNKFIQQFPSANPEFWETYFILGNYYKNKKNKKAAVWYYRIASSMEITTIQDKEQIEIELKGLM